MATILVDPTFPSNGAGTLGNPRNIPPTSVAYGDLVLFKEGTNANLGATGWTVPAPSGTPSLTNQLVIGTYAADTGLQTQDPNRRAQLTVTGNSDVIFIQNDHVRVENLYLYGAKTFPSAGVRALNCSYITVKGNRITSGPVTTGGGYGVRLDNATGSGAARSNWTIVGNTVERTGGNSALACVWSSTAGENVTDITITDNDVTGNPIPVASAVNHGVQVIARAAALNANRSGLCARGMRIERNTVRRTHAYGYSISGVVAGGTQPNVFRGNKAFEIGDGGTDMHCMWFACCDDWLIEGNLVDGSNAWIGQDVGTGIGIFIDKPAADADGCNRVVVRGNLVRNTGRGATLNSEVGGAGIASLLSNDILIEGNIVENCNNGIIAIGRYSGNGSTRITIRHNLIANHKETGIYAVKDAQNVSVLNNICIGGKYGIGIQNSGVLPVTVGYSETNNLIFGASIYNYMGSNEPEAAVPAYVSRTAPAIGFTQNPRLVDASRPWLGLSPDSPAIGKAAYVPDACDVYGYRYGSLPNIGPFAWANTPSRPSRQGYAIPMARS